MIHQIFRRSIKARFIIMIVSILMSVVIVLTLVTALTSARLLEEESKRQLSQSLFQSVEMLSSFMEAREVNLDIWSSNPLIDAIFSDPALAMVFVPSLREYFSKIRAKEPWISNIFLIQEDTIVYDDSDAFEFSEGSDGTPDGINALLSLPDEGIAVANLNQFDSKSDKNVILVKRKIVKNGSAQKNYMVLILDMEIMNRKLFGRIQIGRRGFVVMAAENMSGEIVVSSPWGEELENSSFFEASAQWKHFSDIPERYHSILLEKQTLRSYALAVLGVASLNDIREPVFYLVYLSVMFSFIALLLGIWCAIFFSGKLISPIFKLIRTIGLISQGDLTQRVDVSRQDEIGTLAMVFNDMTSKLQENHAALKKAEEKYRSIFENAVEGIFQSTPDGYFLSVNPALSEILGYDSPDDIIGAVSDIALQCCANPDARKIFYKTLRKKGKIVDFEVQQKRKDDRMIWISISARSIWDDQGRIKYYEGSYVDITPRKSAENALKKYQEHLEEMVEKRTAELKITNEKLKTEIRERVQMENALRESEQTLYYIIEFLPDAIVVIDKKGRVIAWNKAVEKMTGVKAEAMLGKGNYEYAVPFYGKKRPILIDLAMIPDDKFEKKYPKIARQDGVLTGESFTPNLPGGSAYLFATASALYDSEGKITGAIELIRDITDRKKAENKIKKVLRETSIARQAAEEANRKITASINYAKMIQRSLLANLDEVKSYLPNSFFIWEPRDIVGGDIFFTDSFEDGFIVAVIDCTGHGVPGAFMTMIVISALKRIVGDEGCRNPSEILNRLNFIVKTTLHQDTEYATSDDGLDIGVCFVQKDLQGFRNLEGLHLTFAGAKLPLYYVRDGKVHAIRGDRQSIGYRRSKLNFDFTNHQIRIEKGMNFYMATDGFTDQLGENNRLGFGKKRLKELLSEISSESFEKQRSRMIRAFKEHKGKEERLDDVTVVGFGF